MTTTRLDAALVARGLARSRQHAVELIRAGAVTIGNQKATKPAHPVNEDTDLTVQPPETASYVGRGALKLAGALDTFTHVHVTNKVCLDAGASTGGFTEVLLRRGAQHVHAYDVGSGQLAPSLLADDRVTAKERTNVRHLRAGDIDPHPTLVVADLSFISLTLVLPAFVKVAAPGADFVVMVKPQFEVGRGKIGAHGVVKEPQFRAEAVRNVVFAAQHEGLYPLAICPSSLPGPTGNIEYFVSFKHCDYGEGHLDSEELIDQEIARAVHHSKGTP